MSRREERYHHHNNEKPHGVVQGNNGNYPKVFFDIDLSLAPYRQNCRRVGRIVMELHTDSTPITAENLRALCTREKDMDGSGKPISYKGSLVYPVFNELRCFGGAICTTDRLGVKKFYQTMMSAENLMKKHSGPGILSMDNYKRGEARISHGSQFFINTAADEQYDGKYVVFGQVVDGMDVLTEAMEAVRAGNGTIPHAFIAECGQLNSQTNY